MKEGIWQQVLTYFYIRKKNPNAPNDINTNMMHGMNRISIFVFFIGLIVMIVRLIKRH